MITKLLARKKAIGGKTEITWVVYILGSLTSESDQRRDMHILYQYGFMLKCKIVFRERAETAAMVVDF